MISKEVWLLCIVLSTSLATTINVSKFPKDFMFGTATASYQVEGAWNEDGKGENTWDEVSHRVPSPIVDNSTGDVACDSYHKYKEDVAMLKHLGVTHYRFSLSWSRILPTGFNNKVNPLGIAYYKNLIKELRANNIEPLVTIFHWDTPQPLENLGGWTNELIVDRFVDFAKVAFENFGDDVTYWLTFNEPKPICHEGYGSKNKAPLVDSPGIGEYLCAHNLLKAHAKAWRLYDEQFRSTQKGLVGITVNTAWFEPDTPSVDDVVAAERAQQFNHGWYVRPLTFGDYPEQMKSVIAKRSSLQGFSQSRLPEFTQDEVEYLKGTLDYLGLNYYTTSMARNAADKRRDVVSYDADSEVDTYQKEEWPKTASSWLRVVPWGLRKLLNWIKFTYGDIPIIITENGVSEDGSSLEDDIRTDYYQQHLSAVKDAMDDGVNVFGFTAWSLMDNFEWLRGYTEHFGMYHVDFESPNRTRTPKKSVEYFKNVIQYRCVLGNSTCDN
ncbi:myrosinase 1-like isoform X4 [Diabrotica virgifera virgifera]|uniref:beta-glucosidase n=1 Tax=Diabrotica virgifera virgifera TaxID=50390 RepID=A0ABM5KR04_DIAVI|nr:myrosinase 1-like isoform X4 [Diabrotica virgifera virgifera]